MKKLRFLAVLAGFAVDQASSFLATLAVIAPWVVPRLLQGRADEIRDVLAGPLPTALCLVVGTLGSVAGGWVAGRLARRAPWDPLWNGAAVGAAAVVLDLCFLGNGRLWYRIAGLCVALVAPAFGAWLAARSGAPIARPAASAGP